jgi:lysophospholipase L1-like esterase
LAAIPLSVIALELLARFATFASGKSAELHAYEGEPALITAYRLKYLDRAGQPYDGLPDRGSLQVKRNTLRGYRLVGDQKTNVWQINRQGFRANEPIAQTKPADEVRIFVLGGSTAFGQLSSSNQTTFASKLESRLNQQVSLQKANPAKFRPDVLPYFADELVKAMALPPRIRQSTYRVVNAAVPGYVSSNELAQLSQQILAYDPDFIVLLDGYADLLLPSQQEAADIPGIDHLLENASGHWTSTIGQRLRHLLYQSYLVRGFQYWVQRPHEKLSVVIPPTPDTEASLDQRLPETPEELNRRVARYRTNVQQISRLAIAAQVPLVLALQPEITSRKPGSMSPREQQVLNQLGPAYLKQVKTSYDQLGEAIAEIKRSFPKGVTVLNLYDAYASFPGEAFQDPIHLTDEANTKLADRLYESLSAQLLLQPKPFEATAVPLPQ